MSIRKREWQSPDGTTKEAWVVTYTDSGGKRRLKTFKRKREAEGFNTKTATELRNGTHVADRASVTVAEASGLWLTICEQRGLGRSTFVRNRNHVELHINPRIGKLRLSQLTVPKVYELEDALTAARFAPRTVAGVLVSLSGILAEAQRRGLVAQNVVSARGKQRKSGASRAKLKIGTDIPSLDEIKQLIPHLPEPRRAGGAFKLDPARLVYSLQWKHIVYPPEYEMVLIQDEPQWYFVLQGKKVLPRKLSGAAHVRHS